VLWAPLNRLAAQVAVAGIGQDSNAVTNWFTDSETIPVDSYAEDLGPGRLTRAGDRLAAVRADGAQLAVYDARAGFGSPPTGACGLTDPTGAFGNPSWAPDGSALVWAEADGIWSSPVASAATMAGGDCGALRPRLLITGGAQPFWGPADAPSTGNNGAPGSGPAPSTPSLQQIRTQLLRALSPMPNAAKIAKLLKPGAYSLSLTTLSAGTVRIDWYYLPRGANVNQPNRKPRPIVIASGKATYSKAGKARLSIRLTVRGKRMLEQATRLKLTAKGTFVPTGSVPIIVTKTFTLKR
jgi:hypothetical protein